MYSDITSYEYFNIEVANSESADQLKLSLLGTAPSGLHRPTGYQPERVSPEEQVASLRDRGGAPAWCPHPTLSGAHRTSTGLLIVMSLQEKSLTQNLRTERLQWDALVVQYRGPGFDPWAGKFLLAAAVCGRWGGGLCSALAGPRAQPTLTKLSG